MMRCPAEPGAARCASGAGRIAPGADEPPAAREAARHAPAGRGRRRARGWPYSAALLVVLVGWSCWRPAMMSSERPPRHAVGNDGRRPPRSSRHRQLPTITGFLRSIRDHRPLPRRRAPVESNTIAAPSPLPPTVAGDAAAAGGVGRLGFAISPWGEVYVDGRKRGVTPPMTELKLPAGRYTVEIRNTTSRRYRRPSNWAPMRRSASSTSSGERDPSAAMVAFALMVVVGCAACDDSPAGEGPRLSSRSPCQARAGGQAASRSPPQPPPAPPPKEPPPPPPPLPKAVEELRRGVQRYDDGEYKEAARHFQRALELGLASPRGPGDGAQASCVHGLRCEAHELRVARSSARRSRPIPRSTWHPPKPGIRCGDRCFEASRARSRKSARVHLRPSADDRASAGVHQSRSFAPHSDDGISARLRMNLHHLLQATRKRSQAAARRADRRRQVRLDVPGAGPRRRLECTSSQSRICQPERARASLLATGWPTSASVRRRSRTPPREPDDASRHRRRGARASHRRQVDIIIDATGSPSAGIRHVLACCAHGKSIVMVNVEADALAGPLLARRAEQAGIVYSLAYGDQPALICEMVDWARAAGFEVVAAGKGTKYLPAYHASTPETVWSHYGLVADDAQRRRVERAACSTRSSTAPSRRSRWRPLRTQPV